MRVLHLAASDIGGGAARGGYFLHRALLAQGCRSEMLVGRKYTDDPSVVELAGAAAPVVEKARAWLDRRPLRRYRKTSESFWTVGWQPRRIGRAVEARDADIVHLHWTGGGFLPLDALRQLSGNVVWTLRDMWAFTGGCHYTAGCERYVRGCGRCPQLRSDRAVDLSSRMWGRRSVRPGGELRLIAISEWLAGCARRSGLYDDTEIEVIPNGIDTTVFRPEDRDTARKPWGFPTDRKLILFGAVNALHDARKGFSELVAAAGLLASEGWSGKADLIVFGSQAAPGAPAFGLDARFVGRIDDDRILARLYAAADVMVVPSRQEAFGKTVVEAMACGTPVVAFDDGGPREIVDHKKTGYLAQPFEAGDLARGIAWCLKQDARSDPLGPRAREAALSRYDIAAIAARYLSTYEGILDRTGRPSRRSAIPPSGRSAA